MSRAGVQIWSRLFSGILTKVLTFVLCHLVLLTNFWLNWSGSWPLPKKTFETNGNGISTTDLKSELLTKILWRTFSEALRMVIMQRPFPGNLKPCGVKPCFFGSFFPSPAKADWILSCLYPSRNGSSLDCGQTVHYKPLTGLGEKTASATPCAGGKKQVARDENHG